MKLEDLGDRMVFKDVQTGRFVVSMAGTDGPVVSGDTRREAMENYNKAYSAYRAMKNLMSFKKYGYW